MDPKQRTRTLPATTSVWAGTAPQVRFPPLQRSTEVDVAIVGGGITGLTLAALLAEEGKKVAVLEARVIGMGSTGNSTGNLYQTLSAGLYDVESKWGQEAAREVARSRGAAVALIEKLSGQLGVDNGFQRCPVVRYADDPSGQSSLDQEQAALLAAGLNARTVRDFTVPTGKRPAVVLEQQAQFHPLAHVHGLAQMAAAKGAQIHELSPAIEVDNDGHRVVVAQGEVRARHVVMATHTPKGIYAVHAAMVPYREYGVALRRESDTLPPGIFWGQGKYRHSVRPLRYGGISYVIVVGEEDKVGLHDSPEYLGRLEDFARRHFGNDIAFCWSAQNFRPPDALPYIGPSHGTDVHIATAFATDGLTYGTLAAMIIADAIAGRANPWAQLYRASRVTPVKSSKAFLEEQATTLKSMVKDRFGAASAKELASLEPGSATVVKVDGELVAAYRDGAGQLSAVSARCTHMGCIVHWNGVERSWDCPCHASRFDRFGNVIEGPALTPLEAKATS